MTETKWTKGDWTAAATSDLMLWVALDGPDGEIIAQLDSVNPYDAHLIAAAPELYEALMRLVMECVIDGKESEAGYDCWISLARKALAKARGETK